MASFSRSGETLVQRCLNAHPDIEVVHQIRDPDTKEDMELFRFLKRSGNSALASNNRLLAHKKLHDRSVLVLKNAVWIHKGPRQGFILVRNPFSLAVSSFRHNENPDSEVTHRKQQVRWCNGIDSLMLPYVRTTDNLSAWMALYTRKMLHDFNSGLPIVRYEDFIADPERSLRKIVRHLGLEWSDRLLQSHADYEQGEIGHGKIKLWRPIHQNSSEKYKRLTHQQLGLVYSLTAPVLDAYGYRWDGSTIEALDFDDRFR
ncbi:sulfotransferase [Rhizobiaceae bacterium n13]|uniref:Sulfotransferase n=1 Tax=Ferirhizobium litorale TaxID=2927786 RepID=A0AAE3QEU0_9HYPH|nr:sulfotransferase [Fererhizobium litorale]MDI7862100.1 sulfotransferase [Fererhizobium litorale]MDI7922628.1 sulfotransferase [Fererhizobium litorale]